MVYGTSVLYRELIVRLLENLHALGDPLDPPVEIAEYRAHDKLNVHMHAIEAKRRESSKHGNFFPLIVLATAAISV